MVDIEIERIRMRLHQQRGRYREVSHRAGVGYSWLSKFANNKRGKRPSWDSIQRLNEALSTMEAETSTKAKKT